MALQAVRGAGSALWSVRAPMATIVGLQLGWAISLPNLRLIRGAGSSTRATFSIVI